jgi:hypothetical protein
LSRPDLSDTAARLRTTATSTLNGGIVTDTLAGKGQPPPYVKGGFLGKPWRSLLIIGGGIGIAIIILVLAILPPGRTTRVTDGSEIFAADLDHVEALILAENRSVDRSVDNSSEPFVSIAYMLPIRRDQNDPLTDVAVRHQLQGAYLAQYWSNHTNDRPEFGSSRPLIKLLLADSGPLGTAWKDTVKQLLDEADRENLVAVAGLGLSLTSTQEAIKGLDDAGIAMVAAVITSSRITANNLWRVAPTNSDEVAATLKYIEKTPEWGSTTPAKPYNAYLVEDKAPRESYSADLSEAYRQLFRTDAAHRLLSAQGQFDSSKPAVGNALDAQASMVCSIKPQAVLFAGRSHELELLIRALAGRWCAADTPLTIITGDDATQLNVPRIPNRSPLWQDQANIEVFYSNFATPLTWGTYPDPALKETSTKFENCQHCFKDLFGDQLDDGHAIMAYDAVVTAVTAARGVASQDNKFAPTADALPNGFYQINSVKPVVGASGLICYSGEAGEQGRVPFNKAVPIMQLKANGQSMLVSLSSRFGTPPSRTCMPN